MFGLKELELSLSTLKMQYEIVAEKWKLSKDEDDFKDCITLLAATNFLEQRIYGESITSITSIFSESA